MKQKVRIIDNVTGKVCEGEKEIRNLDHFKVQLTTKAHIFKDRTKYSRKIKHKKPEEN